MFYFVSVLFWFGFGLFCFDLFLFCLVLFCEGSPIGKILSSEKVEAHPTFVREVLYIFGIPRLDSLLAALGALPPRQYLFGRAKFIVESLRRPQNGKCRRNQAFFATTAHES